MEEEGISEERNGTEGGILFVLVARVLCSRHNTQKRRVCLKWMVLISKGVSRI